MENFKNADFECFSNKKELMANKEKYAKLFSEGRESLEQLLLTCYNNNIMSHACCSGHIIDNYETLSYVYLRLCKRDLGIISNIINEFKNSNLREVCDVEESIKTFFPFRDYYGFIVRTYFDTADMVYERISNIINAGNKQNVSLEYEVLGLLKKELLEFRRKVLPKYSKDEHQASIVDIVQSGTIDEPINYIKISSIALQILPNSKEKTIDLDLLTKYINDHDDINYTDLIYAYNYEDDKQLEELKRVLSKKNR